MIKFNTNGSSERIEARRIYVYNEEGKEFELFFDSKGGLIISCEEMIVYPLAGNCIKLK